MSSPSPFEPGYVPPKGAKLPPPLPPEAWQQRPVARRRDYYEGPQPVPDTTQGTEVRINFEGADAGAEEGRSGVGSPGGATASKTRFAIVAGLALALGLGGGFGLGYTAGADKTANPGPGTSNVQRPTAAGTADHIDIDPPEPELSPDAESQWLEAEAEWRAGLSRDRQEKVEDLRQNLADSANVKTLVLPDLERSFTVSWDDTVEVNDWRLHVTRPQDVTEELLEHSHVNTPPPEGHTYQTVQLNIEHLSTFFGHLNQALTVVYVSEDGTVSMGSCGSIPNDLANAGIIASEETTVVNACIPVPADTEGNWYINFDGELWLRFGEETGA